MEIGEHIIAEHGVYYEQVIPKKLINLMLEEIDSLSKLDYEKATIGNSEVSDSNLKVRDSKVYWLNQSHWITSIFSHYINVANIDVWEYDLTYLNSIQVSTYNPGGHYTWHCDYGTSEDKNNTRKLSASLLLSDESEHKGGNLQLIDYNGNIVEPSQKKGTMIVFDSRVPHRVTKVKKGTRISLVAWMLGPKLR